MRHDGRDAEDLRRISCRKGFQRYAEGSALISFGDTKVVCSASVEEKVPSFLRGQGKGWVTAEYALLPRSTHTRSNRDSRGGKIPGRSQEIQRLIGRSLRSVVDLSALGERTITVDCDVLQADGGTRSAAITGGFVALALATRKLKKDKLIPFIPIRDYLAAVSVGIVDSKILLDLDYEEDSSASVDMNVVMTGSGKFVEIQGTAEQAPFSGAQLDRMLSTAKKGIEELVEIQKKVVGKLE